MKIVVVGVEAKSLINFRGDLIKLLIEEGHEVVAMASGASDEQISEVQRIGARFHGYYASRTGLNPASDLRTLANFLCCFRRERPDVVLAYTIKPVIWGGIASRLFPKTRFVALVTGLGYAFGDGGLRRCLIRAVASTLYRVALRGSCKVLFQNQDNLDTFKQLRISPPNKVGVIRGSGINLTDFAYDSRDLSVLPVRFLMIARLLGDKGVREYLAAAKAVKDRRQDCEFLLVGPPDSSPDRVPIEEIMGYHEEGVVSYLGEMSDVRKILSECSVFVLPSYHEGLPRTVLEAMATGRPIITTDVPGCRETVIEGVNGLLVSKGNTEELVAAMDWCCARTKTLEQMGTASRKMAEESFDVLKINNQLLAHICPTSDQQVHRK